ncbi:MAG: helix-turn-helix domain-containing protein [Pyrinomonadaceae bacterium]
MSKQLLTAKEVSEITGLKPARIYELTRKRQIPFILIGERQYLYPESRIADWCLYGSNHELNESEVQK